MDSMMALHTVTEIFRSIERQFPAIRKEQLSPLPPPEDKGPRILKKFRARNTFPVLDLIIEFVVVPESDGGERGYVIVRDAKTQKLDGGIDETGKLNYELTLACFVHDIDEVAKGLLEKWLVEQNRDLYG